MLGIALRREMSWKFVRWKFSIKNFHGKKSGGELCDEGNAQRCCLEKNCSGRGKLFMGGINGDCLGKGNCQGRVSRWLCRSTSLVYVQWL